MPQIRLNAALDASAPLRVDRAARRINGVSVMTIGEAVGHGFRLNEITQETVVALALAAGDKGIKAQVTHAGAGDPTKYLGRMLNFRKEGEKVLADLQLSEAAAKSPSGNLADYVLTLAEEDPTAFGMSMQIEYETDVERTANGQVKRDANGKPLKPFARVTKLRSVDVVGTPAANPSGLFSEGDDVTKGASALLDSLEAGSPEALLSQAEAFLRAYLHTRFGEVPQRIFSKGIDPMTAEQKARADQIAALCTKYLGDNDETKAKAAAFAADEAATLDTVKDALLAELHTKATAKTNEPPPKEADLSAADAAVAKFQTRQTEITSLCVSAMGDTLDARKRAEAFLNDPNVTTEAVRNAMFAEMAAKLKTPATGDDPLKAGDKEAKRKADFEAEYDAHATVHAQLGVTKEQYVTAALADAGSPVVVIAPKTNV